jgi:hypothetical protein
MGDLGWFLLIQFGLIFIGTIFWLIRSLYIKNKKLEEIVQRQNTYLEQMYETIKYTENRIKEIDKNQIFQGDDEIGFFFTAIKGIQESLSEYIKFIK